MSERSAEPADAPSAADEAAARERLAALHQQIEAACARSGRAPAEVELVAVSKRQPVGRITAAVRAGVRTLGENYVQELRLKRPVVESLLRDGDTRPRWRMIGALQRNKARAVVLLCDAVDSLDRISLARELDRRAGARGTVLEACIQVNLSREPQKNGVAPDDLAALLAACAGLGSLRVVGLMTVPAAGASPEQSRPAFAQLRGLRDTLRAREGGEHLTQLSMGMSGDFEVAIEEGATLIRVGTAVFGPREDPPAGGPSH